MSIGRICVRQVDTTRPDELVAIAADRMHQRAVGALVVTNERDEIVGIVTDRDLVARVLAKGLSATETPVCDVMTESPKTISECAQIESALAIMRRARFRRLPVVDHDSKLVGLITLDDILMLLAEEISQIGGLLKRETPQAVIEEQDFAGISRLQNETRASVGD